MSQLTGSQRRVLPLAFAATLTSIMGNSLLAPAIPDILDTFDRPDSSAGLLIAATSLPGIVMAPIIGVLADRLGRRAVLSPCLFVFGVAGILVATAPSFGVMLLARFLLGLGGAGLVNLAIVLLTDTFSDDDRTRWIGANSGVLTVALAIFPLASGAITDAVGWRWALAPQALAIAAAVATWRLLEPGRPATPPALRAQLSGAGAALRNRTIATSIIASALTFAVIFGVFLAALPTHLESDFGLGAGWRGVVIGIPALTSSMVAFNLGRLRRRFAATTLLSASALLWMVAFTLIGLAPVLGLLLVGSLLYGFGEGGMIPTLQDVAMSEAPDEHRAAVMAAWTAAARVGQTVGPLVAALLLAGPGSTWALLSGVVGAVVLAGLLVGDGRRARPGG